MALTDLDLEKLAILIRERPPTSRPPDCMCASADHEKAHRVLDLWIANDTARKLRNEKIKATVIGGMLISSLVAVGNGALVAMTYLKEHLK